MNNSYLLAQGTMSKYIINGSTIIGRFGVIILLGLAFLSLASCGGGGGSDSGSTMQITPPSSGDGADLVVVSLRINPPRSVFQEGERFTLSVVVRNQGNARAPQATVYYGLRTSERDVILGSDLVRSLGPSETSLHELDRSTPASGPGTYYFDACVVSSININDFHCSDDLRITVTTSSGDGGSGNGGSGGGGAPVTAVWPCPFGNGSITVPNLGQAVRSAENTFSRRLLW